MATIYGTSNDGIITGVLRSTWADVRNDATGLYVTDSVGYNAFSIRNTKLTKRGTLFGISRVYLYFDTSGISVVPSSATLKIHGFMFGTADVIAVRSEQSATLATGDYDALYGASTALGNSDGSGAGTLAGVSGLTYSAEISTWSTSGYNDIALNATALSDMASLDDFKVCLMHYDNDYLDIEPTGDTKSGMYFAEDTGTSRDPYIDYTAGTAVVADNATFFGANF